MSSASQVNRLTSFAAFACGCFALASRPDARASAYAERMNLTCSSSTGCGDRPRRPAPSTSSRSAKCHPWSGSRRAAGSACRYTPRGRISTHRRPRPGSRQRRSPAGARSNTRTQTVRRRRSGTVRRVHPQPAAQLRDLSRQRRDHHILLGDQRGLLHDQRGQVVIRRAPRARTGHPGTMSHQPDRLIKGHHTRPAGRIVRRSTRTASPHNAMTSGQIRTP